jgi:hypothetical protein
LEDLGPFRERTTGKSERKRGKEREKERENGKWRFFERERKERAYVYI